MDYYLKYKNKYINLKIIGGNNESNNNNILKKQISLLLKGQGIKKFREQKPENLSIINKKRVDLTELLNRGEELKKKENLVNKQEKFYNELLNNEIFIKNLFNLFINYIKNTKRENLLHNFIDIFINCVFEERPKYLIWSTSEIKLKLDENISINKFKKKLMYTYTSIQLGADLYPKYNLTPDLLDKITKSSTLQELHLSWTTTKENLDEICNTPLLQKNLTYLKLQGFPVLLNTGHAINYNNDISSINKLINLKTLNIEDFDYYDNEINERTHSDKLLSELSKLPNLKTLYFSNNEFMIHALIKYYDNFPEDMLVYFYKYDSRHIVISNKKDFANIFKKLNE